MNIIVWLIKPQIRFWINALSKTKLVVDILGGYYRSTDN